jgi:hypothetical protein
VVPTSQPAANETTAIPAKPKTNITRSGPRYVAREARHERFLMPGQSDSNRMRRIGLARMAVLRWGRVARRATPTKERREEIARQTRIGAV